MERVQGEVGHRASVVEFQEWKLNSISDFAFGRGVDCRGDRPEAEGEHRDHVYVSAKAGRDEAAIAVLVLCLNTKRVARRYSYPVLSELYRM